VKTPLLFFGIALFVTLSASRASEDNRIFEVWDSGMPRWVKIADESSVFEVTRDGEVVAGPFGLKPQVTIALPRSSLAPGLAESTGASSWNPGVVGGFYIFHYSTPYASLAAAESLWQGGYDASPTISRPRPKRFSSSPQDPYFSDQWHLQNTGRRGGKRGVDINVLPAWAKVRGRDIYVAICDDGVQVEHPDLAANSFPVTGDANTSMHFNFETNEPDPNPVPDEYEDLPSHGTAVAGLVGATANEEGGVGAAPAATLAGLVSPSDYDDGVEAEMMQWRHNIFHIHNNSWGPIDDGETTEGPGLQTAAALEKATLFGRDGKGVIFVFAGGNGRPQRDDSNYDGYANSIHTIAVGAVSDRGFATTEGEGGANLVVVAPTSSRNRQGQITTDLMGEDGYNQIGINDGAVIPRWRNLENLNYTNDFGMTSGAAPLVSGVVALMLEANPGLGWRDVQEILIRSARRILPRNRNWKQNKAGYQFHPQFGAGMVDAAAAVNLALSWKNLPAPTQIEYVYNDLALPVTALRRGGARVFFQVSEEIRVEHVQFTIALETTRNNVLFYILTSPSGMRSVVPARTRDRWQKDFGPWTFLSVRHWGESSVGTWTLQAVTTAPRFPATLLSAGLTLHGTPVGQPNRFVFSFVE